MKHVRHPVLNKAGQDFSNDADFYRLILDSLTEYALLVINTDLIIIGWNAGAEKIFGIKANEVLGEPVEQFFTQDDIQRHGMPKAEFSEALEKGCVKDERWHVRANGKLIWCYGLSFPLKDKHGDVHGFVKLVRDDTARKLKEDALRENEELLRLAAESAHLGTFEFRPSDGLFKLSERSKAILDIRTNAQPRYEQFLKRIHPDDRASIDGKIKFCMREGGSICEIEFRILPVEGEIRWGCITGKLFEDRLIGTVVDVTAQKQEKENAGKVARELEERVRERTNSLTLLNKEMETFAYSASHDLRAPLRKIAAFSQLIAESGESRLSERDQDYFRHINKAVKDMNQLIDNILLLAQVTRRPLMPEGVDLSREAEVIAGDLQRWQSGRKVEFYIQPGVKAKGDRELLVIALRNLLDNAWKFTGKKPASRIEFGMAMNEGTPVFFVRDNGAGFDMDHAGRLFKAFQRLHRSDEFPGVGVGLGMVERIILRHQGRIWAESKIDEGATFYFTLGTES